MENQEVFDYLRIHEDVSRRARRLHAMAAGLNGYPLQETYCPVDLLDGLYCEHLLWNDDEMDFEYYLYAVACINSVIQIFQEPSFHGHADYFDPIAIGRDRYPDQVIDRMLEESSKNVFQSHLERARVLMSKTT